MMLDKYPDLAITVYGQADLRRVENLQDVAANYQERYRFVQGDIRDAAPWTSGHRRAADRRHHQLRRRNARVDRSILNLDAFIQTWDVYDLRPRGVGSGAQSR